MAKGIDNLSREEKNNFFNSEEAKIIGLKEQIEELWLVNVRFLKIGE